MLSLHFFSFSRVVSALNSPVVLPGPLQTRFFPRARYSGRFFFSPLWCLSVVLLRYKDKSVASLPQHSFSAGLVVPLGSAPLMGRLFFAYCGSQFRFFFPPAFLPPFFICLFPLHPAFEMGLLFSSPPPDPPFERIFLRVFLFFLPNVPLFFYCLFLSQNYSAAFLWKQLLVDLCFFLSKCRRCCCSSVLRFPPVPTCVC